MTTTVGRQRLWGISRMALVLLHLAATAAMPAVAFQSERVSFAVRFKEERTTLALLAVFALPGERMTFEIETQPAATDRRASFEATAGAASQRSPTRWEWHAPSTPGLYPLEIVLGDEKMILNAFVMVPADRIEAEHLMGYRLGRYPQTPLRGLAVYRQPRGFVTVTPQLEKVRVSPHFRLGQFLCKQESGYPKIVVLRERLLRKLEMLLEELNRSGCPAETLFVMSGYRTPFYNRAIGNVKYSRHIYGDAADVFVDEDGDGYLDDLNGDGARDDRDADILHELVESMAARSSYQPLIGGLSRYRARPGVRGPFVHVDTRGFKARW